MSSALKRFLIPIAHGSEEIETISFVGTLRRVPVHVDLASIETTKLIQGSRSLNIEADHLFSDLFPSLASSSSSSSRSSVPMYDAILLPGGVKGAERFRDHVGLVSLLRGQLSSGFFVGAICASPALCLSPNRLIPAGSIATCHKNFWQQLRDADGKRIFETEEEYGRAGRVVTAGNLVTSQGPGTAIEMALEIVKLVCGEDKMKIVADVMMVNLPTAKL